jgi:membrane dipeptidase
VDLHCDALLGGRDLLVRSSDGHVDVPRLLEGQVALTVFTAVTQFPWIPRQRHNAEHSRLPDAITGLALAQGWPRSTWGSFMQRALYQARELRGFVARSGGQLVLVRSRQELQRFRAERRRRCGGGGGGGQQPIGDRCPQMTAAVLGVEGLLALELERDSSLATAVQRLRQLHAAGVRLLGLNHFTDTALSGSAHGEAPDTKGLSALGSLLIPLMERMGFVLDLAHASEPTIRQVLALATKPLVISHTGLKRMCARPPRAVAHATRSVAAD